MTINALALKRPTSKGAHLRNRLIMTLGDKGGSGKSFFTRALAGIHFAAGTDGLLLIDGDSTVGTLVKFFGDGEHVEPFIIDHHPADARIVIAGHFSGHGYKFCSVVGEIVAGDRACYGVGVRRRLASADRFSAYRPLHPSGIRRTTERLRHFQLHYFKYRESRDADGADCIPSPLRRNTA